MTVLILNLVHNALTMLYGIFLSLAFVGVMYSKKNLAAVIVFCFGVGGLIGSSYALFGEDITEKIYPLIIHFPLVLFLKLFFNRKFWVSVLSVLMAYLSCQVSNWIGLAVLRITGSQIAYYSVRMTVTIAVFVFFIFCVCDIVSKLLQKPTRSLMVFSVIPIVYYLYDYIASVYTKLLYSGDGMVVEFLGFMLCVAFILFLLLYFKQYEEKCESQRRNQFLELQQDHAKKSLEALRRSEHLLSITRHDMRHFLANISGFIEKGDSQKAQDYIQSVINAVNSTAMKKYCNNETVNMIISSNEGEFEKFGINFLHSVVIPEKLSVSDIELTSILSNALENAIKAAAKREDDRRIELDMRLNGEKLLISVKNTFLNEPKFRDGFPETNREGHGFGTQSIRYATEKLKGHCRFSVENNLFILRVII